METAVAAVARAVATEQHRALVVYTAADLAESRVALVAAVAAALDVAVGGAVAAAAVGGAGTAVVGGVAVAVADIASHATGGSGSGERHRTWARLSRAPPRPRAHEQAERDGAIRPRPEARSHRPRGFGGAPGGLLRLPLSLARRLTPLPRRFARRPPLDAANKRLDHPRNLRSRCSRDIAEIQQRDSRETTRAACRPSLLSARSLAVSAPLDEQPSCASERRSCERPLLVAAPSRLHIDAKCCCTPAQVRPLASAAAISVQVLSSRTCRCSCSSSSELQGVHGPRTARLVPPCTSHAAGAASTPDVLIAAFRTRPPASLSALQASSPSPSASDLAALAALAAFAQLEISEAPPGSSSEEASR